ncbi:carbohydrate ABC transporter permease [Kutzneria buriramensis]|uniref:Multiple sugar transport system permease protein n=1 Tax=Kutzneria buriramensis TaxID=1045776 RepID=A0A3E0GUB1_9PSEU|nr:carbohydrate ABC transporter permease [Kutzneria buriramensis]REH27021.1 multiple sugar transport system permease protein [Kutzneria buriramensis]
MLGSVLAVSVVPFAGLAIPLSYLLAGQRDSLTAQVLPSMANAYTYRFCTRVPRSRGGREDASELYGAGVRRTCFAVVAPMSKPAFASATVLTFLTQWGSFLWRVLMVSDPTVRPPPLAISVLRGSRRTTGARSWPSVWWCCRC